MMREVDGVSKLNERWMCTGFISISMRVLILWEYGWIVPE